jgi:hypothetical protein
MFDRPVTTLRIAQIRMHFDNFETLRLAHVKLKTDIDKFFADHARGLISGRDDDLWRAEIRPVTTDSMVRVGAIDRLLTTHE